MFYYSSKVCLSDVVRTLDIIGHCDIFWNLYCQPFLGTSDAILRSVYCFYVFWSRRSVIRVLVYENAYVTSFPCDQNDLPMILWDQNDLLMFLCA